MVLKKKQKRLIFFLPSFILGGAGESIFKLSKFLVKYNFSILIISLGKNFYNVYDDMIPYLTNHLYVRI